MPELTFLIIGAQKAGTTSLFEYMRKHPEIYMPNEKEIYFFNSDVAFERGKNWYLSTVFGGAPDDAVCGEATAQYMAGVPYVTSSSEDISANASEHQEPESVVPERIKSLFPDVKLICVLRDPVARAYSHYRMAALNKVESRSFDQLVDDLTEPQTLARTRADHRYTDDYVVLGEYARILRGFQKTFPSDQLKIVFSQDLEDSPAQTLASIFEYIGVDPTFIPHNLNNRYLAAADKQRIPGLNLFRWRSYLSQSRALRGVWHRLPVGIHARLTRIYSVAAYRIQLWNAHRNSKSESIPPHARQKLIAHYLPDSEDLAKSFSLHVPWLDDWAT